MTTHTTPCVVVTAASPVPQKSSSVSVRPSLLRLFCCCAAEEVGEGERVKVKQYGTLEKENASFATSSSQRSHCVFSEAPQECVPEACPSMVASSCVTFVLPPPEYGTSAHNEGEYCRGSFTPWVIQPSFDHDPSFSHTSSFRVTPPPSPRTGPRPLTLVFDLDETLAYKRQGPLVARPYLNELLAFLGSICHVEVVVWTAGLRHYAQEIVSAIDPGGVIKHCVYRHRKWYPRTYQERCAKNLALTGRDPRRTIIIDNNPECMYHNAGHGIVCHDFEGCEQDVTLKCLLAVLKELTLSPLDVPEFIKQHPELKAREVRDKKGDFRCYFLDETKWGGHGVDTAAERRKRGTK